MRDNAHRDDSPVGGSKLWFYFSHGVNQIKYDNDRSLQRRFPSDGVLLLSGDSHGYVAKLSEIATKFI